jgi:hypothetical protein
VRASACLLILSLAACTGGMGDDGDDAPIAVGFLAPGAGTSFVRDQLAPTGRLVANVAVELSIDGAPSRVALSVAGVELADADADGLATVPVGLAGPVTLTATAFDAGGAPAASAELGIVVEDPAVDCRGWLDLYQVAYNVGPNNEGVVDPVTAQVPINGMSFRYSGNANPRASLFGDCTLIKSLAEAAPYLRARDVVEVTDIGVYNYRCIGGGTPPDCPNGISQHAYATAIDLAGFTDSAGTFASVNDDWVIDPDDMTCTTGTEPGLDTFLHELICELKAAGVWNIVLTPNYNADHRNHFHVDLTPGSDFIRSRGRVDAGPDHH